ncbi:CRE-SRT-11 protein [Caenorhabditis remanei]|uniref:CRE-SRT-11 protein n=1 Tax=Caenorhabditis remanei TaxID=31234 RepID=E3LHT6_CAERE|nr:CRE-SRT-11 protein [Caenorhabditis remanei]
MSALQMSMYHVFTNSFTLWPDAYECPKNLTTVKTARPVLGSFFLFFGVLFISLYIPCFLAIVKKKSRAPVYQIMFALAIFDILSLSVNSVGTGIFDILGISFCHYPLIIFCLGATAGGSWMAGCLACVMLAIERCVEINPKFPLEILFRKRVFPIVRIVMIGYTLYAILFVKGLTFSLDFSCWFFDPLIGKDPLLYHSYPHTYNNFAVGISTTVLYIYISYRLIFKFGYSTSMWLYKTKRQILFQAITLCIFHTAAAFIYEYMQFIEVTPVIIIVSQFVWAFSNGAVCIAYLCFNRTIRNMVLKMIIPKKIRSRLGLYIGFDEHLAVEEAAATASVSAMVNAAGGLIKFDNFTFD